MLKKVKLLVLRTSGFAIAGSLAITGQAQAQSVDVNFTGNVGSTCAFGVPTTGGLAVANANILGVSALGGYPTVTNTGTVATVTLSCGNGGLVTVSAPQKLTAPAGFTPEINGAVQSFASANGNETSANINAPFTGTPTAPIAVNPGTQTVIVGMIAGYANANGQLPPAGNYSYKVTLTATPQ